jgi:hypothetical protein
MKFARKIIVFPFEVLLACSVGLFLLFEGLSWVIGFVCQLISPEEQ